MINIDRTFYDFLNENVYSITKEMPPSDERLRQMVGFIAEHKVSKVTNGTVKSALHYDVLVNKGKKLTNGIKLKKGDRIEVKGQALQTAGVCWAYNLSSKQNNCEYIALCDMTKDKIRLSIIPEAEFFSVGEFNKAEGKENQRFCWDGNYNTNSDNKKGRNAALFIKWEVAI